MRYCSIELNGIIAEPSALRVPVQNSDGKPAIIPKARAGVLKNRRILLGNDKRKNLIVIEYSFDYRICQHEPETACAIMHQTEQ